MTGVLTGWDSYDTLRAAFRWKVPERFNIAVDTCERWAREPGRTALIHLRADGIIDRWTFADVWRHASRLSNVFRAHGLRNGDRVAILLPQAPETAVAHVAAYASGLIALPLSGLFGPDALEYRLADAGARTLITDAAGLAKISSFRDRLPGLQLVLSIDGPGDGAEDFAALNAKASERFTSVDTSADDPALITYTSGTTGPPKGALHAHRSLLGHLPGVEFPHDFFPQPGDRFWTPADWAWIGGLMDVLLPAWHHGIAVVAYRAAKFDPEQAFALIAELGVRNMFLPPTALKLMRQVRRPRDRHAYSVRSVGSGGEPLGTELLAWGEETFGLTINEFYGQTECNLVLGNCASVMPVRPGSMGRPMPGHDVAVVDDGGTEVEPGTLGEVAVRGPDPVMFLGYWGRPSDTADKFHGEWLLTGDLARRDDEGYFWFAGRKDDVITSAGYRIGPGEIEDCLLKHPAVAMAAVIGVPDPVRTERIKAFVVPAPDAEAGDTLADSIRAFVRERLAAHEYPRDVEFVTELPLTTTGKVMRGILRDRERSRSAATRPMEDVPKWP